MQSTLLTNIFNSNQDKSEFYKTVKDPGFPIGGEGVASDAATSWQKEWIVFL